MKRCVVLPVIGLIMAAQVCQAESVSINPSRPTHYFYTPAAYVNPPYHLVTSLHEISFSLPARLALQASIINNIGRVNFGAKFGILDNLSIGAGMAHTFAQFAHGRHGIGPESPARVGVYMSYGFVTNTAFEAVVVPHTQIGNDRVSIGADLGFMLTPSDVWSVIWEAGSSLDLKDELVWLNFNGGIRIHPPSIPFLSFDVGVDAEEFPVEERGPRATPYFDVIFAMIAK